MTRSRYLLALSALCAATACGAPSAAVQVEERMQVPGGGTSSTTTLPPLAPVEFDDPLIIEESSPGDPFESTADPNREARSEAESDAIFVAARPMDDEFGPEWDSGPSEGHAISDPSWLDDPMCDIYWMSTARNGKTSMSTGWSRSSDSVGHRIVDVGSPELAAQVLDDLGTLGERCPVVTGGLSSIVTVESAEYDDDGLWLVWANELGQRSLTRAVVVDDIVSVLRLTRLGGASQAEDHITGQWFLELVAASEARLRDAVPTPSVVNSEDKDPAEQTDERLLHDGVLDSAWSVRTGEAREWPQSFPQTEDPGCEPRPVIDMLRREATSSVELVSEQRTMLHSVIDTGSAAEASELIDAFVNDIDCYDPESVQSIELVDAVPGQSAHVAVIALEDIRLPDMTEYVVFAVGETVGFITVEGSRTDSLELVAQPLADAAAALLD